MNIKNKGILLNKCPNCGQKNSVYRSRTDDIRCKSCGCIWENDGK